MLQLCTTLQNDCHTGALTAKRSHDSHAVRVVGRANGSTGCRGSRSLFSFKQQTKHAVKLS